jgi:hypothetical protein
MVTGSHNRSVVCGFQLSDNLDSWEVGKQIAAIGAFRTVVMYDRAGGQVFRNGIPARDRKDFAAGVRIEAS